MLTRDFINPPNEGIIVIIKCYGWILVEICLPQVFPGSAPIEQNAMLQASYQIKNKCLNYILLKCLFAC